MNNLKYLRLQAEMTIQELSDESGVNRVLISRYENEERELINARVSTILKLADALEIEDIRLFFRSKLNF